MPSFYRGESKHTDLFERLNLVHKDYEMLSQDLNHFICRSVLEKMQIARGRRGLEGGGTLGELRRVGRFGSCFCGGVDRVQSSCDFGAYNVIR